MIRVGITGLGFMGMVHYLTYRKLPGVEVAAMCDQDRKRLAGDWRGIQGNFGPPGEEMDLSGISTYESVDAMIDDPHVDLIDITLPPSLHAEIAVKALRAGKHVFCEKPMAMTIADCDRMMDAAEAADRSLMVGHVLPFFPEYSWALREIRGGEHGRLLGGSFKRIIADPAWLANYWSAEAIGGPLLDLHVHDAHFIRLACGMPTNVSSRGSHRNGLLENWHSLLEFPDPNVHVHVAGGVVNQQGRPFLHGFEIRMERATLVFEFSVLGDRAEYQCPPTILRANGEVDVVELGDGDPMNAFELELTRVLAVLAESVPPDALAAPLARDAIEICHRQAESAANRQAQ